MGNNFNTVFGEFLPACERRVLILGNDGAGKTMLLYRLKLGELVTTIPTIGFNVEEVTFTKPIKMKIVMWDVGGMPQIRPLWRHYYANTNAIIFVVDSQNKGTFEEARESLKSILENKETQGLPILILANKKDLPGCSPVSQLCEILKLHTIRNRDWYIQSCSVTNREGIQDGMSWLCKTLSKKK